jgi:hypothetical protein
MSAMAVFSPLQDLQKSSAPWGGGALFCSLSFEKPFDNKSPVNFIGVFE